MKFLFFLSCFLIWPPRFSFKTREEYENSGSVPTATAAESATAAVERTASFERISKLRSLFSRQTSIGGAGSGGKAVTAAVASADRGKTSRSWRKQLLSPMSTSQPDLSSKSDG